MATIAAQAEATFERRHGVHPFTTRNRNPNTGTVDDVTVVSQPNWDLSVEALESLRGSSGFVLLPELMTLKGDQARLPNDLRELRFQQRAIEKELRGIEEFSTSNPNMTIALGSATFNGASNGNGAIPKPSNSFLFFRGGRIAAQSNQQFPNDGVPQDLFLLEQARGGRTIRPDVGGVVGADLAGESRRATDADHHEPLAIVRFAKTVLVSSGVTLSRESLTAGAADPEDALKSMAAGVFQRREEVDEIIIADRVPDLSASGPEGPLNAHIVRAPN